MRAITLPDGTAVPALGLGTWNMGEHARSRDAEIAAVRTALELGYRLIDTAEMYGDGGAEEVIGTALAQWIAAGGRRDDVFIVSKVYPHNGSERDVQTACERSLQRLGLDRIDLYLLHWRGSVPLAQTMAGFARLLADGRIARWGVSNFDVDDMEDLFRQPGGSACAANQIYYSATRRGAEFDLLPWLAARRVPAMAYSPIDVGALAKDKTLAAVGQRHGASAAQAALAFVLAQRGVIAIPKAVREVHLRENLAAADLALDAADQAQIDARFPRPSRKQPLATN